MLGGAAAPPAPPWNTSMGGGQTLCSWVFHKPWKIKNNLNISETQILHVM